MERPTSRMAKTVRVLATAHSMPARMAIGMRWLIFVEISEDLPRSLEESGNSPARREYAGHHAERDGIGREAGVDELCGRLGRAQPDTRSQPADHANTMD